MCRLFGIIGAEPIEAKAWLVDGDRSLLALSRVSEEQEQDDGWGIAWYDSARIPRLEKGDRGAFRPTERERFLAAAERARGHLTVAHLRKASNPMHLPKERLWGPENSQPFTTGSDLFAHNGMIPFPRETRARLGKWEARIKGVNDSEVLFLLFAHHVEELGDPLEAYRQSVRDLVGVWEDRGRPEEGPYSGLNVVYSRGPNDLWAFCHWRGEHGAAFRDPDRPYYRLAYRADSKRVLVGSEPVDGAGDWRSLENGEFLHAQSEHGLVAMRTGALELPELSFPAARRAAPT